MNALAKIDGVMPWVSASVRADLAEVRDDMADLVEDRARLDWLEMQFADGVHVEGGFTGSFSAANLVPGATVFYGDKECRASTIRAAIDAARAGEAA